MTLKTNLGRNNLIAFVNIVDVDRARTFYSEVLGLRLLQEDLPFALVFDANGTMLRLAINKERANFPGTVLGWQVPDIQAAVSGLESAGVDFERYDFLEQDDRGIWHSPAGAEVAWFKDPDGNLLSLTQFS